MISVKLFLLFKGGPPPKIPFAMKMKTILQAVPTQDDTFADNSDEREFVPVV